MFQNSYNQMSSMNTMNSSSMSGQMQQMLQQMSQMEQQHASQLKQITSQLQQIAQHESMAGQHIQQLQHMCNQLIQENQRLTQTHSIPEHIDLTPKMYPRHFGVTFTNKQEFLQLLDEVQKNELPFFQELTSRFKGKQEEHLMFFLVDPANNLLEFKFYHDTKMAY